MSFRPWEPAMAVGHVIQLSDDRQPNVVEAGQRIADDDDVLRDVHSAASWCGNQ